MRFFPYVVVVLAVLNLLYGLPILASGRSTGLLLKALPVLGTAMGPEAIQVYGIMFGALASLLGLVRLLCGLSLLRQLTCSREAYVMMMASFAVELLRDIQFIRSGLVAFNDSAAIALDMFFLGWAAAGFKAYTHA